MNNEIVLDEKSGISIEEQKEIMSQINGITEKNRQKLAQNAAQGEENIKIDAKKKSAFFPLVVNISAGLILIIGFVLLFIFNRQTDTKVRTGFIVYNHTERALIDEIRKSTAEQIAAKEWKFSRFPRAWKKLIKSFYRFFPAM